MFITIGKLIELDNGLWLMETIGTFTPLYSVSLFLPTIIKTMGYKNNEAQLMTVPPYVVACAVTISGKYLLIMHEANFLLLFLGGFIADRTQQRGLLMIVATLIALVGFSMLIATENVHIQYAGTFFAASGIYCAIPGGVAWNANNIGGSTKRYGY